MTYLLTDRTTGMVAADSIIVLSCALLNVAAMRRFHARPDLVAFRLSLLLLAGFFATVVVVFLWDIYEVMNGSQHVTLYVRWLCAVAALGAAVVFIRPGAIDYYHKVSSPEQSDEHRREIDRLIAKLKTLGKDGT
jgi:hypothetical protein